MLTEVKFVVKCIAKLARRKPLIFCFIFFAFSFLCSSSAGASDGLNGAVVVICKVIGFFRGRYTRAIVMIAIMTKGALLARGNLEPMKWFELGIGILFVFNAESVVYFILPMTFTGVGGVLPDGTVIDPLKRYSPQEFMPHICPQLIMY